MPQISLAYRRVAVGCQSGWACEQCGNQASGAHRPVIRLTRNDEPLSCNTRVRQVYAVPRIVDN